MLISIFASIGSQNLGDELILKNEIQILREKYKSDNPRFVVFTYDLNNLFYTSEDIEYKEYFPVGLKRPQNIIKNIKNFFVFLNVVFKSNLIVIGGGGLFFDNEIGDKNNPLDLWVFRIKFFNLFLKKIYFFRVGLSIKKEESFLKILKIFSGKKHIIEVRDNYSKKILEDLGLKNIIKKFDPVFEDTNIFPLSNSLLKEKEQEQNNDFIPLLQERLGEDSINDILNKKICIKKILKDFNIKDLKGINFENKKVGIAFRSGYLTKNTNPELEILLIKEIIEFIQKSGAKVFLLAHSFHKNDILSNDYDWMKLIQKKTTNVGISHSMEDTYSFYKEKKIDIILAQRLHSIILSQVYEIPFVGISYSKKTEEILSELR